MASSGDRAISSLIALIRERSMRGEAARPEAAASVAARNVRRCMDKP